MDHQLQDKLIDLINITCERKGIKKIDLARQLDMNPGTLGKYLLKQREMPAYVALNLAQLLQINLNRLCGIQLDNLTDTDYDLLRLMKEVFHLMESMK